MTILFIIGCTPTYAADYDFLLSRCIKEYGIYTDSGGLVYAAASHDGSYLITVYADSGSFTCKAYGSENEPADEISFNIGGKNKYRLEITNTEDDLCISMYTNEKGEYFRLINDAFTKTLNKPKESKPVLKYSTGKISVVTDPYDVYDSLNDLKSLRVSSYTLPRSSLTENENRELMYLIKSCADLMQYDSGDHDIHTLMRHMLYTYRNFTLLSSIPPNHSVSGKISLYSSDYIDDALYKAFRLQPEKPAVNMLTELGYCYNNGVYYSAGGYDKYFATDVMEITDSFELEDGSLLIIFKNTYTEGDSPPIPEISSAVAAKDESGFYLLKLNMGGDLPSHHENTEQPQEDTASHAADAYMPLFIIIISLAVIGIIIYRFIII